MCVSACMRHRIIPNGDDDSIDGEHFYDFSSLYGVCVAQSQKITLKMKWIAHSVARHGTDILAIRDDIMTLHVCLIFKENL